MEFFWGIIVFSVIIYLIFFKTEEKAEIKKVIKKKNNQGLVEIKHEELPLSVTSQLFNDEKVYYFSYLIIENDGGCFSSSARADYWIALTNKRLLYKAKVKDNNKDLKLIEKNGIILFDKIGSIEIIKIEEDLGCSGSNIDYALNVGSMGNNVCILLPNEHKGFEIRKTYMEVVELLKRKSNEKEEKENNLNE